MASEPVAERRAKTGMRVGLGEDLHRLVPGRPLILGGVPFDSPVGLLGHSDGDVVLHAVADALLGAAGLGDIGEHFSDEDPAHAGADSSKLLAHVVDEVRRRGYAVGNVDVVIHAQRPKLGSGKERIRARIAELLDLDLGDVNIKAKTGEGLDAVGREEAIACRVVALLDGRDD